ncbi:MAG: 50S ribosomal protein L23 [Candidatus Paceibacterota bacterium]
MATTKTKKNKDVAVVDDAKKAKTHPLIKGVRVTEKAALAAERGAYTFNVEDNANKNEIKKAIKLIYGVTPLRVTITQITAKKVVRRGKVGMKKGGKKAVVYLKKGDKITIA